MAATMRGKGTAVEDHGGSRRGPWKGRLGESTHLEEPRHDRDDERHNEGRREEELECRQAHPWERLLENLGRLVGLG